MILISKFYKKIKKKINIYFWLNIKKGHKKFYNKKKIHIIRDIKSDFYSDEIKLNISNFNKFFFFDDNQLNTKILKQKFVSELSGNKFLYLFYFFTNKNVKGIYCLPKNYLDHLSIKYDVKINFFLSKIFFSLFVILNFFQGIKKFILIVKDLFFINNLKLHDSKSSYDLFFDFNFKNFNIISKDFDTKKINIVNWIISNFESQNLVLHGSDKFKFKDNNINISSNKKIYEKILNPREVLKNIKLLLSLFLSIFVDLIFLRWWNVIFFSDACDFILFKNSKFNLAKRYFFLYTSNPYKPLWTYAAEAKGSEAILLTISVQTEINNSMNISDYQGIYSSTWKNYLVWNENHKDYILNRLSNKDVKFNIINSHVNYKDSNTKINIPKNSISVFSYENHRFNLPHSSSADWSLNYKGDWHHLNKKFWQDIITMMKIFDFYIINKNKRNLPDRYLFKKDKKFKNYLSNLDKFINIDSNVAIERIVNKTNLTISLPFTSASVVAKNLKRKAIYYDPISYIQKEDPNRSNVEIISGIEELEQYLRNNLYLY